MDMNARLQDLELLESVSRFELKHPQQAYGKRGIPSKIPTRAMMVAEIEFIADRDIERDRERDMGDEI